MASEKSDGGKPEAVETIAPTDAVGDTVPVTPVTPQPVDGGIRSWLQVVGSFLVFTNLWGFTFAFGSFQSYYQLHYLSSQSPSDISWIGTVSTFLLIVVGVISGPLFDLGHFRAMLLVGACMETLGLFLLSFCSEYYQIMLTQGVMMGLANGLMYLPGLALVGRSFKKRRSIAMAIITTGAPTGGIIYTLMFEQLIGKLGFAWTIRAMGFVMLGSYLISFPLLLWRARNLGDLASGHARKLFDPTAFRDLLFWSYTMSNFFLFLGYITPFVYIGVYGQTHLGLSQSMSLNIIVIAQAASIAGRLVVGYTASKIGVMMPWTICGLCSGIFCLAWIGVKSEGSLIAFAVLFGFSSGPLIPLPPSIFPVVCSDPRVLGARLGMAQAIGSIASLIGSPISGALLRVNDGAGGNNYIGLQLFSGLAMLLGGCQLVVLWTLLIKKRGVSKLI